MEKSCQASIMVTLENKTEINCGCYLLFALFFIIFLTIYSYGVFFLNNLGIPYRDIGLIIGISALFASILQPLIGRQVDIHHFMAKTFNFFKYYCNYIGSGNVHASKCMVFLNVFNHDYCIWGYVSFYKLLSILL